MRVFPLEARRFSVIYMTNKRDLYGDFVTARCHTNHIKYLISSEPHRHFNPRRIDAKMVIPF